MSLPHNPLQNNPLTIELVSTEEEEKRVFQEEKVINFGRLEVDQTKELNFNINCSIPKVKVICEQETDCREKEIEKSEPVRFMNASTKNLKIKFKANRGGVITLVMKIEALPKNKTLSNEDLKAFEQIIKLKYQTNLSIIDVIPENEIEIIKPPIGKGGEAVINKAKYDGEIVVIKTYEPGNGMKESEKMSIFRNKYIVEYKKSFYREINNQKHFCTMLEYAEYGSLDNVKHLIEHHVLYKIMEDVCKALKYLHVDKKVIHRDIKPQNILIFNYHEICDVNAKLTDFGTSEMISSEGNFGKFGTDNFMAPEVVKGKNYTNKCDIYSLGITMLSSFLKIGFENATSNTPQKNGTYIKTTANLKADIGQLIIRCCQIDPLKRPDIDECLKSIQEIIKNFGDKDVFESINTEQEDVRFAIPKFSLFSFVKEVVKSIKELKVTNDFIKGKLMLKFKKDTLKAYTLINQNRSSLDNKGDVDYAKARNYLEAKKTDLTIVGNNLMISAAEKSHPDAIMHLIDILIDIDRGKLKIYDYEKHRIRKIVKDTFSMNPFLYGAFPVPLPLILQKLFYTKISAAVVMNIFSVLRKYIPLCELYYGIALLRGVGIKRSISNAEPLFNSFKRSEYCRDKLEVQFYQVYCTCIRNNIQEINKEAYNMLDECIAQSKNQRYYSDALNNKGVLLYNGLGCDSDIKKAFEYFKQSMELNNDYGKFNYALCLRNHEELLTSSLTNKDGLKIIQTLAKQDFSEAQRFCAIAKFQEWSNNNADSSFFEAIHWRARASLQLDYHSIYSFGKLLDEWNLGKKKGDKEKLKEFAFTLYNIASQSGYLKAQIELIKCYKCGRGTKKNLEEARNWCIKALDGNKNDEEDREYGASKTLKSTVEYHYLIIVKEMCTENKDSKVTEEALDLIKTLENTTYNKTLFELGMCYFDGVIVSNDKQKAIDFFERAVKENNKKAFYRLGVEYLCGTCIEKDEKKGVEYLLSASKEGVQEAIEYLENSEDILDLNSLYSIGSIYLKGADPIKKDFDKAIKYLIKAAHYNNIHIHQPIYPTFPQPNDVKPPKIPESNQESPQYADPDYPVYVEPYYVGTLTPNNGRAYLILCDTYLGEGRVPKTLIRQAITLIKH